MHKHNFSIFPVILKHKVNQQGLVSIYIKITINRRATYMVTDHRVRPAQWDEKRRQVVNHDNAALLNVSLRRRVVEMEKRVLSLLLEGKAVTKESIAGGYVETRAFIPYAREVRDDAKELNRIEAFAGKGLQLHEVTVAWLRKYEQHERRRGMAQNTMNTTFRYLRRILRQAHAEKLIAENPFSQYTPPKYVQSERVYLTEPEKKQLIKACERMDGTLQTVTWFFLLGCYSGLRHSDWVRFDYDRMVEGEFLKLRPKKTRHTSGAWVVLPIGPTLQRILQECRHRPHPPTNQKCNEFLKAAAGAAGLKKALTTHVGRHSFGYMCASNRIPKSVTAELMGITVKTVEVYYHLSGSDIVEQAAVLKTL